MPQNRCRRGGPCRLGSAGEFIIMYSNTRTYARTWSKPAEGIATRRTYFSPDRQLTLSTFINSRRSANGLTPKNLYLLHSKEASAHAEDAWRKMRDRFPQKNRTVHCSIGSYSPITIGY